MPLWGLRDFVSGNNKPIYANTANVYGVSAVEAANAAAARISPGWVEWPGRGKGYVASLAISNVGSGINRDGFITFTGGGNPTRNANASYTINTVSNTISSFVLNHPGEGYESIPTATVQNTVAGFSASFAVNMGGRIGRNVFETLVFTRNITGDADANTFI